MYVLKPQNGFRAEYKIRTPNFNRTNVKIHNNSGCKSCPKIHNNSQLRPSIDNHLPLELRENTNEVDSNPNPYSLIKITIIGLRLALSIISLKEKIHINYNNRPARLLINFN